MAVVLVVDDDPDSCEVVARRLRKAGHTVTLAPNGHEAMAALSTDMPDVVVLDYRMPFMDGISFLEVIRCYLRWQSLPVILLTAYADGPHIRRAHDLGVRRTFLKADYDLDELLVQVEACRLPILPSGQGSFPSPRSSYS